MTRIKGFLRVFPNARRVVSTGVDNYAFKPDDLPKDLPHDTPVTFEIDDFVDSEGGRAKKVRLA